ncbi:MAG TPA: NADH-quinone oxidoreductase subunit NuoK [Holophaga sp.]|jgi:NADH-quinone oxidoreductase subunit K|nr:NADH-quinone oxidoreductase subunit NuoK [Holophaga sp.]
MPEILTGNLAGYILVALLLFVIGLGTVLTRRSLIIQFMGVELMLNAANVALLAFGRFRQQAAEATTFYLFILAVAACEAAVGLALVVALFRLRGTTDSDRADSMRQ